MRLRYPASVALATAALVASALPAFGADNGTVNAKVTVAAPCLTLSFTNPNLTGLDFGTRPFGGGSSGLSSFFSVVNCGSSAENVSARGTNATSATSTASWNLQNTFPGPPSRCPSSLNVYGVTTNIRDSAGAPQTSVSLSTSDTTAASAVSPGSRFVDLTLFMPCPGSGGAGETMNFQFIYTASF